MKLLADENFPLAAIEALRQAGYDVLWVRTTFPGASDEEVLARAHADGRVLVTFDKDFGELAFARRLPACSGIVLFRLAPRSPAYVATTVLLALQVRSDWEGHFAVVEETRLRMRRIPDRGG